MKRPKRFAPEIPFPPYQFIPGRNPHPLKKGGYSFKKKEPIVSPIEETSPEENGFYNYAIDLINYRFYWEAHV